MICVIKFEKENHLIFSPNGVNGLSIRLNELRLIDLATGEVLASDEMGDFWGEICNYVKLHQGQYPGTHCDSARVFYREVNGELCDCLEFHKMAITRTCGSITMVYNYARGSWQPTPMVCAFRDLFYN